MQELLCYQIASSTYRVNISSRNEQAKPGLLPGSRRRRRTPARLVRSACWKVSGREPTGRFPQGGLSLPEQAGCKLVLDVSIIIPQVHEARPVYTWSVCSALTRDMLRNRGDPRVFTEKTAAPAGLAAVCSANPTRRETGRQPNNSDQN